MLYEALLTLDLPRLVGPPVYTGFWDGFERLLFAGTWSRRAATCSVSSAAVLAGSHAALRAASLGAATYEILDDAGELLAEAAVPERWGDAPPPWAEILPPRWTEEPCAFRLRATWEEGGFAAVALLRHTPRHEVEQAALSGVVRAAWSPEDTGVRLDARLALGDVGRRLAQRLRTHGDRVTEALADGLGTAFGARAAHRSRVVVLAGDPARYADLLAGFPDPAIRALGSVRDALADGWPALADDGVEGRWTHGRFVPGAEVDHAV